MSPQLCEGVGVPVADGLRLPPDLEGGDVDPLGLQLGSMRPFISPQLCEGAGVGVVVCDPFPPLALPVGLVAGWDELWQLGSRSAPNKSQLFDDDELAVFVGDPVPVPTLVLVPVPVPVLVLPPVPVPVLAPVPVLVPALVPVPVPVLPPPLVLLFELEIELLDDGPHPNTKPKIPQPVGLELEEPPVAVVPGLVVAGGVVAGGVVAAGDVVDLELLAFLLFELELLEPPVGVPVGAVPQPKGPQPVALELELEEPDNKLGNELGNKLGNKLGNGCVGFFLLVELLVAVRVGVPAWHAGFSRFATRLQSRDVVGVVAGVAGLLSLVGVLEGVVVFWLLPLLLLLLLLPTGVAGLLSLVGVLEGVVAFWLLPLLLLLLLLPTGVAGLLSLVGGLELVVAVVAFCFLP